jgi:probable F420-dependent oxidoreductase
MRFGVFLPTVTPAPDRDFVLAVAQAADRLGFDSVWTADHVVLPGDRRSQYPYVRSTTEVLFSPGVMWVDPIATMGFVAGSTDRVTIGTSVLILPYRHPVVLANEVASLDRLSGGRIVLGIGVGWMDEEFEALGLRRSERGARTDEYLQVLRTLWSAAGECSFEGRWISFRDVALATAPLTPGGPPVWIGGNEEPALRRAVALGAGWAGFEIFPEEIPEIRRTLDRLGAELDRDPSELTLSVRRGLLPPFEVTNFLAGRRCIAGSANVVTLRTMKWFAADVMPKLN